MGTDSVLTGIRVLDFGWVLAAPYATRLLADYGAEVIKVQPLYGVESEDAFSRGYFNTWNRNKLGITLNMACAEGRDLALKLTALSDVVVENFSPRVMENWGLGYEQLREVKPDIILLSMSVMGRSGPWRDRSGFGPTVHAASGLTHLTGFPGRAPSGPGFSYADHVAGLFGAMAVLEALEHRRLTGLGKHIDLSELEATVSLLDTAVLDYTVNGREAAPSGNRSLHRPAAPHGVYPCRGEDRWCAIAVFTDEEWLALRRVMGEPPWAGTDRFATLDSRLRNIDELDRLMGEWTGQHSAEEVMTLLQEAGVAAGVVQDASDLARDPQLQSRGFFITLDQPGAGLATMDGAPMKLSESPAAFRRAAPLPGQDNDYIFGQLLGLGEEERERMRKEGVI
ncbi:MAG: CoA transferase [Dehalococcoidia bacterium]|nr:CoA transferase [Dehalococcoidia bacterium]